jgi:hypothetical protein
MIQMKKLAALTMAGAMFAAAASFTGTITDTMCGKDHTAMHMPDAKCVTECVKAGAKYALYDGKTVYTLSDQKGPEKFAGQKVKITGTYDATAKVLKVDSMTAAAAK